MQEISFVIGSVILWNQNLPAKNSELDETTMKRETESAGVLDSESRTLQNPIERAEEDQLGLNGRTIINDKEFICSSFKSVIIPDGVTQIGSCAFSLSDLESLELPSSLRIIGGSAFSDCSNLRRVEMKEGLESIGYYSFGNNTHLTDIYLPDGIQTVDCYAFLIIVEAA